MKSIACTFFLLLFLVIPAAAQNHEPLPETFVSEDERMTLRYPTGWVVQNEVEGQVLVATSSDIFTMSDDNLPSGEAALALVFIAEDEGITDFFVSGDPVTSLSGFMKTLTESSNGAIVFSPPEATTFGTDSAARANVHMNNNDGFIIFVEYSDATFSFMIGVTAGGEMGKYEPKLLAIAESVNYAPE